VGVSSPAGDVLRGVGWASVDVDEVGWASIAVGCDIVDGAGTHAPMNSVASRNVKRLMKILLWHVLRIVSDGKQIPGWDDWFGVKFLTIGS
jgi:hypothetical protein